MKIQVKLLYLCLFSGIGVAVFALMNNPVLGWICVLIELITGLMAVNIEHRERLRNIRKRDD